MLAKVENTCSLSVTYVLLHKTLTLGNGLEIINGFSTMALLKFLSFFKSLANFTDSLESERAVL